MKIEDIKTLQQYKFIYKLINKNVPVYFLSMSLIKMGEIHDHNTRNRTNIILPRIKHDYARKRISYIVPYLLNNSPALIIDKVFTHSLAGFALYVKQYLINGYNFVCLTPNCYACNSN